MDNHEHVGTAAHPVGLDAHLHRGKTATHPVGLDAGEKHNVSPLEHVINMNIRNNSMLDQLIVELHKVIKRLDPNAAPPIAPTAKEESDLYETGIVALLVEKAEKSTALNEDMLKLINLLKLIV